jgi:hypothetical protein
MTADTRYRTDHTGTRRFSEGIEQLPDTPDKRALGRFSLGIEHQLRACARGGPRAKGEPAHVRRGPCQWPLTARAKSVQARAPWVAPLSSTL